MFMFFSTFFYDSLGLISQCHLRPSQLSHYSSIRSACTNHLDLPLHIIVHNTYCLKFEHHIQLGTIHSIDHYLSGGSTCGHPLPPLPRFHYHIALYFWEPACRSSLVWRESKLYEFPSAISSLGIWAATCTNQEKKKLPITFSLTSKIQ